VEKMYVPDALIAKEAYAFNVQLPDVLDLTSIIDELKYPDIKA